MGRLSLLDPPLVRALGRRPVQRATPLEAVGAGGGGRPGHDHGGAREVPATACARPAGLPRAAESARPLPGWTPTSPPPPTPAPCASTLPGCAVRVCVDSAARSGPSRARACQAATGPSCWGRMLHSY